MNARIERRYERAGLLALDPQASDPITELGEAEMALGKMAGALAHFKQALAINPNDSVARARLGRFHF